MKCKSYNQFFEVMANKTRLQIIESLNKSSKCVKDICIDINQEQSKVSHNLKSLTNCHFVEKKRSGKKIIYTINQLTIKPLLEIVKTHVKNNCCNDCPMKK